MDSFTEPHNSGGNDISLEEVRQQIQHLETEHKSKGVELTGRVIHVCHYLPVISTLTNKAGVLSPPATPPSKNEPIDGSEEPKPSNEPTPTWTLAPRYGHNAMISGIRSLSATHEQVIVGWTGDIQSPSTGENVPTNSVPDEDRSALEEALSTWQPREADPDDDKKTKYVPVWMDDKVAHGHYDGYSKQSVYILVGLFHSTDICFSVMAAIPLLALARCRHGNRKC
jgi:trehalose 6-phosphate synthase/phosphatase